MTAKEKIMMRGFAHAMEKDASGALIPFKDAILGALKKTKSGFGSWANKVSKGVSESTRRTTRAAGKAKSGGGTAKGATDDIVKSTSDDVVKETSKGKNKFFGDSKKALKALAAGGAAAGAGYGISELNNNEQNK